MQTAIREIRPPEAKARHEAGATLIDVREQVEWDAGHIAGALFIPQGVLLEQIAAAVPDRDEEIVLYCRTGARSGRMTAFLQQTGYTNVVNMAGGIVEWSADGLPVDAPTILTPAQQARYSRHLLIPEVGTKGQAALLDSKVLLIGAGGLGSPAALYLAAAGVGTIGIVDFDVVEASNLQRQVIHSTERLGRQEGRLRAADDRGAQPRCAGRDLRRDAQGGQRRAAHRRLRRDPRRDGHVRDALPRERLGGGGGHPGRARLGLPVRGPADDVRSLRGPVLPLPLPDPAAAGARARLLRGRACSASCPGSWACSSRTRS